MGDIAKGIVAKVIAAGVVALATFFVGYFCLDFAGAFTMYPREFLLLIGGSVLIVVVVFVWTVLSTRKEFEKTYSERIKELEIKNADLKRDYDVVNSKLLDVKAATSEKKRENAIRTANEREKAWTKTAR